MVRGILRGYALLKKCAVKEHLHPSKLPSIVNFLQPYLNVENPLDFYLNRHREQVCRNQYRHAYSFTFICACNDTHNCRLRAFVRMFLR